MNGFSSKPSPVHASHTQLLASNAGAVKGLNPQGFGAAEAVMIASQRLLDQGVFVHGIRPPTVAHGTSRLRVTPMASHTTTQIDQAIAAFQAIRDLGASP